MEGQLHAQVIESIVRRRWIVLTAFVVTTLLTLIWVLPKPAMYESSGTYVIQPRSTVGDDGVRALEALIRSAQINATYALIARSDAIKDTAAARLDDIPENSRLGIGAEAVTGTNALRISGRARDAETAQALAVAAGAETIAYVDRLAEPYTLVLLDPPERPSGPIDSRKPLTLLLGALLGLLLGVVLARLVDRVAPLRWSLLSRDSEGHGRTVEPNGGAGRPAAGVEPALGFVLDATSDPGVRQEMAEASYDGSAYSVGVLKLAPHGELENSANGNRKDTLGAGNGQTSGMAALLRDQDLPNGHTLWHLRDGLFASVLPDMSAVDAGKLLEEWVAKTHALDTSQDDATAIEVWIAIVECNGGSAANGQTSDVAAG